MSVKKNLLTAIAVVLSAFANAQTIIPDTVSIGAGYANQLWYSLTNDEQGSAAKNNWDLAFDVTGMGSSIYINSITGTQLWIYPNGDTGAFATLDTAGLSTWQPLYNSDTSWVRGAFDETINSADPFDLGWGVYSMTTHYIIGDSLYVIKLSDNSYRKLWVEKLASGTYQFRYAHLDGTNNTNATIVKANYANKNFGYYSLLNNTALDREPLSADWDLLFTQYTSFIPQPYTVTGLVTNKGVQAAKVDTVTDVAVYRNWSAATFNTAINEIGYNWKTFNGSTYDMHDSLLYFVKTTANDIWKIVFTGFGGSANGNYYFTKEKISTNGINEVSGSKVNDLLLYPNPGAQGNVHVLYTLSENNATAIMSVTDLAGKVINRTAIDGTKGFHEHTLSTENLKAGIYFIAIAAGEKTMQQKLVVY